jgi:hypothetical protein
MTVSVAMTFYGSEVEVVEATDNYTILHIKTGENETYALYYLRYAPSRMSRHTCALRSRCLEKLRLLYAEDDRRTELPCSFSVNEE